MSIGKIIRQYRDMYGMSMQEFATKAGLSKGYISMLEKGRHPQNGKPIVPSIDTVNSIASAMGMSIDALLEATDADQPIGLLLERPVYEAAAGEGRYSDGSPSDEIKGILLNPDEVFVTVKGRSMEPTLLDGDLVVVSATNVADDRQIALVKINGEEATLKRVEVKPNGILLIGDNVSLYPPRFYTDEEVRDLPVTIEGIVVKLIRDI